MNSRLAVSVLFVLVAVAASRPAANNIFKKFETRQHLGTGKVHHQCGMQSLNRITARVSALKSESHGHKEMINRTGASVPSSEEGSVRRRVMHLIESGRHTAAFETASTAVRQIREVLDLMRTN